MEISFHPLFFALSFNQFRNSTLRQKHTFGDSTHMAIFTVHLTLKTFGVICD